MAITKKKSEDKLLIKLKEDALIPEAYLTGLFWSNPDNYGYFPDTKINANTFLNPIYHFYFGLGRAMAKKGITTFDDISIANQVKESEVENKFDEYGGFETISEIIEEVSGREDNFDAYYSEVKKFRLLKDYRDLFGDKVLEKSSKYDYKYMDRDEIALFWQDKVNSIGIGGDSKIEEYDLLDGLRELIEELDNSPDIGLSFFNSEKLTEICNGWGYGTITLLSGFSGNGKTSFAIEKIIMSCVQKREPLLIMANEMSLKDFKKMLLVSVMGSKDFYDKHKGLLSKGFNRKNINKGGFSPEEKERLHKAVDWIEENILDMKGLIKFVPLEQYTIDNVERTIRYYHNRGIKRMILDTAKPTEGQGGKQRWEIFVADFEKLYKLIRPEGGGLNIALFCTIQAADEALKFRYLDERCIADGKKIKNVCDTVWHMRPVWSDELDGGDKELEVFIWIPNPKPREGAKPYVKKKIKLEADRIYYLLFTSKNRRGQSNLTGLDVLVLSVDFNSNRWNEIGWTNVAKDGNFM